MRGSEPGVTKSVSFVVFILISFLLTGCASVLIPAPTYEETQAARSYKKTVALIECRDVGSSVRGVDETAMPMLEQLFIGRTNLVERKVLGKIFNEWQLQQSGAAEKAQALGKLLGAQYLVTSNVVVSFGEPRLREASSKNKKGEFSGTISDEIGVRAEVALRVIDATTGLIVYAENKEAYQDNTTHLESFDDEARFNQALSRRSLALNKSHNRTAQGREDLEIVSHVVHAAVRQFENDMARTFAQEGQILQFVTNRQVLVNLGSAYGVKPGDTFIVWAQQPPLNDPKTGAMIIPKSKQALLRVVKVTSGLSCIAQGSAKDVSSLHVGDKVYTY